MYNSQELCRQVKAVVERSAVLDKELREVGKNTDRGEEIVEEICHSFLKICEAVQSAAAEGIKLPDEVITDLGALFWAAQEGTNIHSRTIVSILREEIDAKQPQSRLEHLSHVVETQLLDQDTSPHDEAA